jgi:DNA-binding LacI/PurR family transcriptional regulator
MTHKKYSADPAAPRQRHTMKEVAEAAGVSIQTVSNFVNGRGSMSEGTRAKVGAAATRLGYHPNSAARGLRTRRTNNLGFLLVDPERRYLADAFTIEVLAGVGDVARDHGFGVLIQPALEGDSDGIFTPVLEHRIDGAVLFTSGSKGERRRLVDAAIRVSFPFVLLGEPLHRRRDRGSRVDAAAVVAGNEQGAFSLTNHLLNDGHRRIIFLTASSIWPMVEQRLSGFRRALSEAGVPFTAASVVRAGAWDPKSGYAAAIAILGQSPRASAIIAGNDILAAGALGAARALRLRVPRDVAIAGFDDFPISAYLEPALTTVSLPGYEMGVRAAELLIQRLTAGSFETNLVTFPTVLQLRGST